MTAALLARASLLASACIVLLLGSVHLAYTFSGTRLWPRDPGVQAAMAATPLQLTAGTTVWRAWLGFNASHALGLVFFGLVYGSLAVDASGRGRGDLFLMAVGLAVLSAQVVLARLFWFPAPLAGLALAWVLFALALLPAAR